MIAIATVQLVIDGIGHLTQLFVHGNTAVDNVSAIPTCFGIPALAIGLTVAARRAARTHGDRGPRTPDHHSHRVPA